LGGEDIAFGFRGDGFQTHRYSNINQNFPTYQANHNFAIE